MCEVVAELCEGGEMMDNALCGVCNESIPNDKACIMKREEGNELTSYHMQCESRVPKLRCEDCGKYRIICNECRE